MPWLVRLTVLSFLGGAAIAAAVVVLSWPRRSMPSGRALIAMMVSVCLWAVPAALALLTASIPLNAFLSKLSYLGIVGVPVFYLILAIVVTKPDARLGIAGVAALTAPAVVVLAMVFTNEWHETVWTALRLDPALGIVVYEHGHGYYGLYGYLASLTLTASVLNVVAAWRQPAQYRASALAPTAAALLPMYTTTAYAMGVSPVAGVDLTPGAFGVAGILLTIGLTRYRILDVVPVARAVVFERLADGIVVLDDRGRVADGNPAALTLLGRARLQLGADAGEPVRSWAAPVSASAPAAGTAAEAVSVVDGRTLHVTASSISVRPGEIGGSLLLVRDVTRQAAAEAALRETEQALRDRVRELEQANRDVRALQDLLPICAYCKRVRTDQDYWQQIESYFATRADVRFSHGICPECYARVAADFTDAPLPPPTGKS